MYVRVNIRLLSAGSVTVAWFLYLPLQGSLLFTSCRLNSHDWVTLFPYSSTYNPLMGNYIPNIWGPFYWHGLTLTPAWISSHRFNKVWDEIAFPFRDFNGCSLGMAKWFHPTHYNGCNYLSMLRLKLIHVCKRGHWLARIYGLYTNPEFYQESPVFHKQSI